MVSFVSGNKGKFGGKKPAWKGQYATTRIKKRDGTVKTFQTRRKNGDKTPAKRTKGNSKASKAKKAKAIKTTKGKKKTANQTKEVAAKMKELQRQSQQAKLAGQKARTEALEAMKRIGKQAGKFIRTEGTKIAIRAALKGANCTKLA